MQAKLFIPEDGDIIKEAIVRGLTAWTPNRLKTKPYWLDEAKRRETADAFDVLVNVDGLLVGFNTMEIEPPEKEHPDCPAFSGSWTAKEAYVLHDMAPGVGYWAELAEWGWIDPYESTILAEIMEEK